MKRLLLLLLFARAIPLAAQSGSLHFLEVPAYDPQTGWTLRWASQTGRDYKLQRSADMVTWEDVAVVRATGEEAELTDSQSQTTLRRFWRVALLESGETDMVSPVVSNLRAAVLDDGSGGRALLLRAEATDNVGVTGFLFAAGPAPDAAQLSQLAGKAVKNGSTWSLAAGLLDGGAISRFYQGTARDAAGNAGGSAITGFALVDPDYIEPVDPLTGAVLTGELVRIDGDNHLSPFTLRPAGASAGGRSADLQISFPAGAGLRQVNGQLWLDFTSAQAQFGASSALRLAAPLTKSGGSVASLRLGGPPLTVGELAGAFGQDPVNGLAVRLYDGIPARWTGGTVEDAGISAPVLLPELPGLPLPDAIAGVGGEVRFFDQEEITIPLAGALELPSSAGGPLIEADADSPLWLTLRGDAPPGLAGAVRLLLPNGTRFDADMVLDDPFYRLTLSSGSFRTSAPAALIQALPRDAAACVPAGSAAAEVLAACTCLDYYREAAVSFSATALGQVPEAPGFRPGGRTVSAVLAWGAAVSVPGSVLDPAPVGELLGVVRREVGAAPVADLLAFHTGLAGIRRGFTSGRLAASASVSARLSGVLDQVQNSLTDFAGSDAAALSSPGMNQVLAQWQSLLAAWAGQGQEGSDRTGAVNAAMRPWLERVLHRAAAGLGVQNGVYAAPAGSRLAVMPLRGTTALLAALRDVFGRAGALGLTNSSSATLRDELGAQCSLRAVALASAAFSAAETAGDASAARDALERMAAAAALRAPLAALAPGAAAGLPDAAGLSGFWVRLAAVEARDSQGLGRAHSAAWHAGELRSLLRIVRDSPAAALTSTAVVRRAVEAAGRMLAERTSVESLAGNGDSAELTLLIEAGTARAALARAAGLTLPEPWESAVLPRVLHQALAVMRSARRLSDAGQVAALLCSEARYLATAGNQPAAGRLYAASAADAVTVLREIAISRWDGELARRNAAPDTGSADMALPGGLELRDLHGTLTWNRITAEISGGFGGTLTIPQFAGSLTLEDGFFSSDGSLELSAWGELTFPNAEGTPLSATIAVPQHEPIHIKCAADGGIEFTGSASVTLSNGMSFSASASLLDPEYEFSFEARGLGFDLLQSLIPDVPDFTMPAGVDPAELLDQWAKVFTGAGDVAQSMNLNPDTAARVLRGAGGSAAPPMPGDQPVLDVTGETMILKALVASAISADDPAEFLTPLVTGIFDDLRAAVRRYDAAVPAAPPPDGQVRVPRDTPPVPLVLQVDFGPLNSIHSGDGPAQALGIAGTQGKPWTGLDGPGTALAVRTSGGPLPVTVGVVYLDTITNRLHTGLPVFVQSHSNTLSLPIRPPWDSALMMDNIGRDLYTFNPGEPPKVGVTAVLSGLPAGSYIVFGMSQHRETFPLGIRRSAADQLQFGILSQGGAQFRLTDPKLLNDEAFDLGSWSDVPGKANFAWAPLYIVSGESILVTAAPGPGTAGGAFASGALSGLQVVKYPVLVTSLEADPPSSGSNRLLPGSQVKLTWTTSGARSVTLRPQESPVPPSGSMVVRPSRTTTYAILAQDGDFSNQRTVTVHVESTDGAEVLAEAVQKAQRKLAVVARGVRELTRQQLEGTDELFNWSEIQGSISGAVDDLRQAVNTKPGMLKDPRILKALLRFAGGEVGMAALATGLEDQKAINFLMELTAKGFAEYQKQWLTADPQAVVDTAKVGALKLNEVLDVARTMYEMAQGAALAGSEAAFRADVSAAVLGHARGRVLEAAGWSAAQGTFHFDGIGTPALHGALSGLRELDVIAAVLNLTAWSPAQPQWLSAPGAEIAGRAVELAGRVTPGDWKSRGAVVAEIAAGRAAIRSGGGDGFAGELEEQARLTLRELSANTGLPADQEQRVLETCAPLAAGDEAAGTALRTRLISIQEAVIAKLGAAWSGADLKTGKTLVSIETTVVAVLRATSLALPEAQKPETILQPLLLPRINEAIAAGKQVKTGGEIITALNALARMLSTPARGVRGSSLTAAAVLAMSTSFTAATRNALHVLLQEAAARPRLPGGLGIAGGLRMERIAGSVFFNRESGYIRGTFSGRLELPGRQAFFEVSRATLDTDGAFVLSLAGGGPLPFAPDISIRNISGTATGSPAGLTAFSATGEIRFPAENGEVSLNGAFSFTGAAGGQPAKVAFTAGLSDAQNLPRFTDDLVLFQGTAGVEFPLTPSPPPVKLTVSGKAGLFHRESPLAAPIAPEDFWLSVDLNGLELLFGNQPSRRATLTFNGGTLRFPADLFFTKVTPPAVPQPFTITLGGGLTACYDFDAGSLCFGDPAGQPYLLNLPALGFFNVPGLPQSKIEITTARLRLAQAEFPVLAGLAADFRLPLPGAANEAAAAAFKLNATEWRIDGLPQQASIQLTEDLPLLPWLQEASLSVLSGATVQITDAALPAKPGYRRMTLTATGGMRAGLDPRTISTENGGSVAFTSSGSFTWPFDYRPFQPGVQPQAPEPQLPSLSIQDAVFEGRFRLGGASGFLIRGVENTAASKAKIVFSGGPGGSLENILHRTASKPFSVGFAGTLDIPAVAAFTLGDITNPQQLTRLVWDQNGSVLPRFLPSGFNVALSGQVLRAADLAMPLYLSSAGFAFINQNLTLPGLLDPSNIRIIASGVAQFPNGAAISLGSPGLRGEFNNVVMNFPKVNGNYTAKLENISALTMELKNLSVPYISDVSGSVSVRNIEALTANPPRPLDVYFAGEVRGKMRGAGVNLLLAASPRELLGACAGLSGGATGIPLDGYTLGGILLTGLEGGLSLQNSFANPCDFRGYVNAPPGAQQMPAQGSPQRPGSPGPLLFPDPPGAPSPQFFDCTGPGFPPPTMNPFCEPHPAIPGRAIFKGARLTAAQLNALGIVPSDPRLSVTIAQGLDACMAGVDFAVQQAVSGMTSGLTAELQRLRNQATGNPAVLQLVEQAANDGLGLAGAAGVALDSAIAGQCRAIFRSALLEAFEQGSSVNPNQTLYQLIAARANEGLKCMDVTVRGSGTFTWQPLSILFDATGSVFLSSTGTEGVEGSLNFLGIPMAKGTAAFMITDGAGNVNPGLGGVADLAIGPFGFGKVSLAAQSGSSVNSVVSGALASVFAAADSLAPAVKAWIAAIVQETAGLPAPPASLNGSFLALTETQRLRLMSRFLAESKRLAVSVTDPVVRDQIFDVIAGLIATVLQSQESTMCMGGQLAPTLFGMPLTGGADTLVGGGVRYQPVTENGTRYYEMSGQMTFSPTIVSLYPVLYSYATALPQLDEATLGMSIRVPSPDKQGVKLALTNPVQWAKNMTSAVINDTVATANYSIAPLGFRLQDVRARVILPRIERHPNNPASGWTGPPSGAAYATREEVVLAALDRGNLGNAQWRGNAGDLDDLFRGVAGGTQCSALTQQVAARLLAADPALGAMSGRGFAADYFPHGGLIYGGQWQMPNVLAQAPPLETIATVLAGPRKDAAGSVTPQAVISWINSAKDLVDNYFLATTCTGQLAGYVPAPSPVPAGVNWTALQADPGQWLSALTNPGGLLGSPFAGSVSDRNAYSAWTAARRGAALGLLEKVVNRDALLNGLYPFDQSFLRGWCQAPLLGLPLAQASASWDGQSRRLMISAQGAPGGWLAQYIGGGFNLEVSPPQYVAGVTAPGPAGVASESPEERLAALRSGLDTITSTNYAAQVPALVNGLLNVVPRVKLDTAVNFTPPAAWRNLLGATALSGRLYAYSPGFDTAATGVDPESVAKRNGGMLLRANLNFGPFLQSANAYAALTPGGSSLPRLSADFSVNGLTLPGPVPSTVVLAGGRATFDSLTGAYTITGSLSQDLTLPSTILPWNVTMPAATTLVSAAGNTVTFSFTYNGSAAKVTLTASGGSSTATFEGVLEIDPLVTGIFSIQPAAAGAAKLRLTVTNGTAATLSSAKLRLGGPFHDLEIPLPALSLNTAYDFSSVTPAAVTSRLRSYLLNGFQCSVSRSGGAIAVTGISCQLPAVSPLPAISLTGSILSSGAFSLASGVTSPVLFGFGASGVFTLANSPASPAYQARLASLLPRAYWKLDETSGVSALDASGNGHSGTHAGGPVINQTGAGWPPAGKSYLFNGTGARISVPDSDFLDGGSAMTVTAWAKANAFTMDWQPLVTKGDASWRLHRYSNTNFVSFGTNTPGFHDLVSTFSINDGQWHHITGVFTGTRKLLYIDGVLNAQADVSGSIAANAFPVMLGGNAEYPARAWNGGLDEVAYFRNALSADSVRDLYATAIGAALTFSGTVSVPGFTGASFAVNGKVAADSSWSLSGSLPSLSVGSFSLAPAAGGSFAATLGSGGISVPALRISLGELFSPVDLPAFNIPSNGNYSVSFSPPELNLRGYRFPAPSLTFRRSSAVTALECSAASPSLPGLPAVALSGSISSSGSLNLVSSPGATHGFPGWSVTGDFSLTAPPMAAPSRIISLAPQAYWNLDETSGSKVADATGNGHQGSLAGGIAPNQPPALFPAAGRSFLFAGTNGTVTVPDHNNLEGGSAMSVTAWIKTSAFTRDWQAIVTKGDSAWRLTRYGNSSQVSFESTSGGIHHSLPGTTNVADGKWHHLAAVYDGAFKSLYLDGRLEARAAYTSVIDSNAQPVMIGENAEATGRNWNGGIDEAAFFRRGLSAAEVRELHAAGNGLRLSFSGSAGLPGINPQVSGSITAGGGFDLATSVTSAPSVFGYGFNSAGFLFQRLENPDTTTFTGSLRLNTLPVAGSFAAISGSPVFKAVFTRENASNPPLVNFRTKATLTADDLGFNLCGYTPRSPGFDCSLTGFLDPLFAPLTPPRLTFSDFRFAGFPDIGDIGLPLLRGTIDSNGSMKVTHTDNSPIAGGTGSFFTPDLNLRNLHAPDTLITFNHDGLNISGAFDLDITVGGFVRDLGDVEFGGRIEPGGSFNLAGNGSISFGAFSTDAFNMRFRSFHYSGFSIVPDGLTPNLNFGNLDMPVSGFGLHQNGLGYTMSKSLTRQDARHLFFAGQSHLRTEFSSTVSLSFDFSSGLLNGSLTGRWNWFTENFAPAFSGGFDISDGISSNGSFTVNNGNAGGDYLFAPFWQNPANFAAFLPKPGWSFGSISSQGYTLW